MAEKAEVAGNAAAETPPEEEDAPEEDGRPRLAEPVKFLTSDTTANVMQSTVGGVLMTLTEGALQYFMSGARANVGLKGGRYMFEMRIIETLLESPHAGTSLARAGRGASMVRVGFSLSGAAEGTGSVGGASAAWPILGDTEDGICFDSDGMFIFNSQKKAVTKKITSESIVAVVLNLETEGSFAQTVSLFRDGERATEPLPLPSSLRGKPLFPTVTFRNATVHVNFGPHVHKALPFRCRMVQGAALADSVLRGEPGPKKDGKYEVLFPICMPDEGTFDWLDWFLEKHPEYWELSDRTLMKWARRSGLVAVPKANKHKASLDKPDMNFGITPLDDGTAARALPLMMAAQQRNFVVMEVRANLLKEQRMDALRKFRAPHFRKVAVVMLGEPPPAFKTRVRELMMKEKRSKAEKEAQKKKDERARARDIEKKKKEIEKAKRKADKIKKKMETEKKRKLEGGEAAKAGEEAEDESDEEVAEEPEPAEEPVVVEELTEAEKKEFFRKPGELADLSTFAMNSSISSFTLPDEDEGFDEIRYDWYTAPQSAAYLKKWVLDHKTATVIEDLVPGDWFKSRLAAWQRDVKSWQAKLGEFKAAQARLKGAHVLATMAKQVNSGKETKEHDENALGSENKDVLPDTHKDAADLYAREMERNTFDVFSIDDVGDLKGCRRSQDGEPLFAHFEYEDWQLLNLRFELHLLSHAFRLDCKDKERQGINPEHVPFYYNKYFKKQLNPKSYSCETAEDLIDMVKDTVLVSVRTRVLVSYVDGELESNAIFVKLTEEARCERLRRIATGDGEPLRFPNRPMDAKTMAEARLAMGSIGALPPAVVGKAGGASPVSALPAPVRPGILRPGPTPTPATGWGNIRAPSGGTTSWFNPATMMNLMNNMQQQRAFLQQQWRGFG